MRSKFAFLVHPRNTIHADMGLLFGAPFALVPDVLEHANRGFALYRNPKRKLDPVLRELALGGHPVHGVVFSGRRYDTGDRLDYLRAVVQLAVRNPDIGAEFSAWLREYVGRSGTGG